MGHAYGVREANAEEGDPGSHDHCFDRRRSWIAIAAGGGDDAAARQGNEVAAAKLKQLPAVDIGHAPFQLWVGRNVREEAAAFRIVWGHRTSYTPKQRESPILAP